MKLIAKKPCSFGGRRFYIGDDVPEELVAEPKVQERMGVLTITKQAGPEDGNADKVETTYTQEQVDAMIADAVTEAERDNEERLAVLQEYAAELEEAAPGVCGEIVQISVKGAADAENGKSTVIAARPEEIQQVFSIVQMNAEEGAKVIAGVTSENVLILLHAADSRKMVKNAAKERADRLFSGKDVMNESTAGNEGTDTNMEGAGT